MNKHSERQSSENIQQVKTHISNWDSTRHSNRAIELLTSGFGFEVSREEYDVWRDILSPIQMETQSIHMYLATDKAADDPTAGKLFFYLVDSETDQNENYELGHNLIVKPFQLVVDSSTSIESKDQGFLPPRFNFPKIDHNEAVENAFQWFLYAKNWFEQKMNTANPGDGIVRVFEIPIDDFEAVFYPPTDEFDGEQEVISAFLFLGLDEEIQRNDEQFIDEISVQLCGKYNLSFGQISERNLIRTYANVAVPQPPFRFDQPGQYGLLN